MDTYYNPAGAAMPPSRASLEAEYKAALHRDHSVSFDTLIAIANNPIGRRAEEAPHRVRQPLLRLHRRVGLQLRRRNGVRGRGLRWLVLPSANTLQGEIQRQRPRFPWALSLRYPFQMQNAA